MAGGAAPLTTGPAGLEHYGWEARRQPDPPQGLDLVGRAVRQNRGAVVVGMADGERTASTKGLGEEVVVGDWVVVEDGSVAHILERDGLLRRMDALGRDVQPVAANVDVVVVVAGLDRPIKAGRIQRSVAQAHDADADALVVLAKADLVADPDGEATAVAAANPGVECRAVSAHTGLGLEDLRERLGGRTVVLLGESGAGKSSLLNALAGGDRAEVGDVRAGDSKGRHTTTRRELYVVGDIVVIDTPGVRAMGLWADVDSVNAAFPDVAELLGSCRFSDCTHDHEPGCALQAAVADGSLNAERLASYRELWVEADAAGDRALELDRDKERRGRRR